MPDMMLHISHNRSISEVQQDSAEREQGDHAITIANDAAKMCRPTLPYRMGTDHGGPGPQIRRWVL